VRSRRGGRFLHGRISVREAVVVLVLVFGVSRVVLLAKGYTFDVEWQGLSIQNIDRRLLRHHLLQSLWYLHGQPPL